MRINIRVALLLLVMATAHCASALAFAFRKGLRTAARGQILQMCSPISDNTVVARCTEKIKKMRETERVLVKSSNDDPNGAHITIECVSSKFQGLRSMQRQQLLFKAIWDEMADGGQVHAVDSIVAKTPEEVGL